MKAQIVFMILALCDVSFNSPFSLSKIHDILCSVSSPSGLKGKRSVSTSSWAMASDTPRMTHISRCRSFLSLSRDGVPRNLFDACISFATEARGESPMVRMAFERTSDSSAHPYTESMDTMIFMVRPSMVVAKSPPSCFILPNFFAANAVIALRYALQYL